MAILTRRNFLIASVAIVGGVAFGIHRAVQPGPNPLAKGLPAGAATFNPWVKIADGKITLITPHADVGQGVAGVQALLIAEEMDLDVGQFEIDFGPPAKVYANTALAEEIVPFPMLDHSTMAEAARSAALTFIKAMGLQMTGGSSTVPDSYTKLRIAGAVARETLKAAAAKRTGIAVSSLKTASGAVVLPDGKRIPYTELSVDAAAITPVQDVKLRDSKEWRLLGRKTQRIDVVAKSTGAMKFGIDQRVDGMLYASVRLNPYKGGPLVSYNAAKAEKMAGVKKIVKITNGLGVIATNTWYAIKAAEAIECVWGPGSYPPEQAEHWKAMEASFSPKALDKEWVNTGDVEAAIKSGTLVEAEYRAPYLAHQPMEPLNALVHVRNDSADIWVGHQIPGAVQEMVSKITGLTLAQVTMHNLYSGGSFGHRLEFENVRAAAEIANQMRGTPIKTTFSREEDFRQDFPRQLGMARNRGAVKDGKIIAADLKVVNTPPSRSQFKRMGMSLPGPDTQVAAGLWNVPYTIPNLRATAYTIDTLSPVSSWRSVGASTGGFFTESFMDEMIHAAGLDPMKARIEMCAIDYYRKVLEAVADMCKWEGPLGNGKGRGVAFVESFGVPCAEVIEVTASPKGVRIDKVWMAADVGPVLDPVNFENQAQGGIVWALGHAVNCELTYEKGAVKQTNFDSHEGMRISQCPVIEVKALANGPTIRGIGEPPVPPAAAALANAIFAATGKRIREMPFNKSVKFV